jgi:DNA-binding SARP family transcriptional activator
MITKNKRSDRALQVVGTFTASIDGRRVALRPSAERIVALLAVRGALSCSNAAGVLWPDLTQNRAMANLRTVVWRVRNDGPGLVAREGSVLRISEVCVDLFEIREWAWRALRGEGCWMPPPKQAACELLSGWGDDWLVEPREELRLLQLYALEAASQRLLLTGRFGEAAGLALAAVGVDPLRESANRLLIEIHLRDGNRPEALRQFHKYEKRLRSELDTAPGPNLTALINAFVAPDCSQFKIV